MSQPNPPAVPSRPGSLVNPTYQQFVPTNPYYGMGGMGAMGAMAGHGHPFGLPFMSNANQIPEGPFQSIQSIVQAFSSISLMLESTYMAVQSSFTVVKELAENFGRLKENLAGVLSITNMFNTIKWFYRRVLSMLNIVSPEHVWNESLEKATNALKSEQNSIFDHGKTESSWPILMFLAVAVGSPYLIYQFQKPSGNSKAWLTKEASHYVAEVLYDFDTDRKNELSLKAGQKIIIAPKEQQPRVTDWLLATIDGKRSGLVPMNYVKILKYENVEKPQTQ